MRITEGHYHYIEAGHDVDISCLRYGPNAGRWTLFVDGDDCGWTFATKSEAIERIGAYVNGYIGRAMRAEASR